MVISDGFKKTDIGTIPEEWEVIALKKITSLMTNGFVGTVKTHYTNSDDGILYIQGYNVEENTFNFHGVKRVTYEFHKQHLKSKLQVDDLLTVQTGDVGLTTIIPRALEGANCHALIITRFIKNKAYPKFYSFYFNSNNGRSRLKGIETGTTMKHINVGDMIHFQVPLPSLTEQQAIAEVLSDTDNLIQTLEKQIVKKRLIKQGVMQKLLTPKEGWEVWQLGEIAKTYGGLSGKTKDDFQNGVFPYIPFLNILTNPIIDTANFDYVNIGNSESQNKALKGDLFFNGSSETPEEVGMCSVLLDDIENLYLNSFCFGLRLFDQSAFDALYLSYFFRSGEGRKLLFSLAQGATRYNLSKTNFLKLKVAIPRIEEQILIAKIISDMDAEITALGEKHHKQILLKQGLMQNLLTGNIRLVKS